MHDCGAVFGSLNTTRMFYRLLSHACNLNIACGLNAWELTPKSSAFDSARSYPRHKELPSGDISLARLCQKKETSASIDIPVSVVIRAFTSAVAPS